MPASSKEFLDIQATRVWIHSEMHTKHDKKIQSVTTFSRVSLFEFSISICSPREHENSAILSDWKLQEYLALSPEDCGTKRKFK